MPLREHDSTILGNAEEEVDPFAPAVRQRRSVHRAGSFFLKNHRLYS